MLKWSVATISCLSVVFLLPPVFSYFYGSPTNAVAYAWNTNFQKLVNQQVTLSQQMFQVAVTLTAAIWGLVVAAPGQSKKLFDEWEDRIAFIAATLLLVISCWFHIRYMSAMVDLQLDGLTNKIVKDPVVAGSDRIGQVWSIVAAAGTIASTIVLDLWILGNATEEFEYDT